MAAGEQRVTDGEFRDFYLSMHAQAFRVAHRILRDESESQDAVSDAFVRTYARWQRVRDLPHREPWVLRVVANVALDRLARNRRRTNYRIPEPAESDDVDRIALGLSIRSLPRRQQEVVILHHLLGYSMAETAATLAVSTDTVKTHLKRALASLRDTYTTPSGDSDVSR